ncbi:hypothetical protein ETH_00035775 [Eimeria tenella]|nr:hypothetical protein ETH_00035775 [Eimeria tenella]
MLLLDKAAEEEERRSMEEPHEDSGWPPL